jgi:hypothetical protein
MISGYQGITTTKAAAIANGQQSSGALDLAGFTLVGILLPAAFTGVALTFEVSSAIDGTYVALKTGTGGSALSYTVVQGSFAAINPVDFQGVRFLKVKSGSAEGGARSLTLMLKGF